MLKSKTLTTPSGVTHIRGFEVAMDHALFVRSFKRVSNLRGYG